MGKRKVSGRLESGRLERRRLEKGKARERGRLGKGESFQEE